MKHLSLTPALVRAARALIEWQQSDLAEAASLSLTAVNNFERKIGLPREKTLRAIQNAFEEHGVEFLPSGGLRHSDDVLEIVRFSGKTAISDWTHYMMQNPLKSGEEFLSCSFDEDLWLSPLHLQSTRRFYAWVEQRNIKSRTLIADGKKAHPLSWCQYRTVPPEIIGKITYSIHGSRLAFVLWKKRQVIVLHNNALVETFRSQFNYLWKIAKPLR